MSCLRETKIKKGAEFMPTAGKFVADEVNHGRVDTVAVTATEVLIRA